MTTIPRRGAADSGVAGRIAIWAAIAAGIGGGRANLADRVAFAAVHDWLGLGHTNFNVPDFLGWAGTA